MPISTARPVDISPHEVEHIYSQRTKTQGHPLQTAADAAVCNPSTSDSVKFALLTQSKPSLNNPQH
jgi:hypothetical protein